MWEYDQQMKLKIGLAEMLKGGVIMDVTTPDQAKIAEQAGDQGIKVDHGLLVAHQVMNRTFNIIAVDQYRHRLSNQHLGIILFCHIVCSLDCYNKRIITYVMPD